VATPCPSLLPDSPATSATGDDAIFEAANLFNARSHLRLLEARRLAPSSIVQATLVVDLAAVASYQADETLFSHTDTLASMAPRLVPPRRCCV
jgi:hypothetical protein